MRRTATALDWIIEAMSNKEGTLRNPPALLDIDKQREEGSPTHN